MPKTETTEKSHKLVLDIVNALGLAYPYDLSAHEKAKDVAQEYLAKAYYEGKRNGEEEYRRAVSIG